MRNHMAAGWFYSPQQIAQYFATRLTSLKPPRAKLRNPVHVLKDLVSSLESFLSPFGNFWPQLLLHAPETLVNFCSLW